MLKDHKITANTTILMYAFRYALGRQSSAPSEVIKSIKKNIDAFDKWELELIVKEISQCKNLGAICDINDWLVFRTWLKKRLEMM